MEFFKLGPEINIIINKKKMAIAPIYILIKTIAKKINSK